MFLQLFLFIAGLAFLSVGGELLVRGATGLATRLGVSRLFIGLTVVAFGTSAPEAVVGGMASVSGAGDLALGNVVGSNIFNVLAILGLAALVLPLSVSAQVVRVDLPILVGVSILTWVLARDGVLGRGDGVLLLALMVANTALGFWLGRRQARHDAVLLEVLPRGAASPPDENRRTGTSWNVGKVVVALALLVVGSRWLVTSATGFARWVGLSDLVIGLTVVAVGTSLPEVATSLAAALRGERDIAVGNVLGSNLFNLLGVLGLSAVLAPAGLPVAPAALAGDLPVMVGVAALCLPIFLNGMTVFRWEGALFLSYFALYTTWTVLRAQESHALVDFSGIVGFWVIPATVVGVLVVLVSNRWRARLRRP